MNKTRRWILLPIEFRGIWYSSAYGGFNIYLRERFEPRLAPDRLLERLRKDDHDDDDDDDNDDDDDAMLFSWYKGDHQSAKPIWLTGEEFEKQFGKIEAIIVDEYTWNSNRYNGYYDSFYFFTANEVITLQEYDGYEYFLTIPRDWKKLIQDIQIQI